MKIINNAMIILISCFTVSVGGSRGGIYEGNFLFCAVTPDFLRIVNIQMLMNRIVKFCSICSCAEMKYKINRCTIFLDPVEKIFPFNFFNKLFFLQVGSLIFFAEVIYKDQLIKSFCV